VTRPPQGDEEGWGPSTAFYSSSTTGTAAAPPAGHGSPFYDSAPSRPKQATGEWSPSGPRSARDQRAVRAAERRAERPDAAARPHERERGLPWWGALLVLLVIASAGELIDALGSLQGKSGFNVGIVVASIVAILVVRRSHMFPVVIAPPIVYSAAALLQLYIRSSGLHDHRVVFDAAANYLVYGFPAIAAATAAVLIIAGVRLIARK
jgi:hypothetical protein